MKPTSDHDLFPFFLPADDALALFHFWSSPPLFVRLSVAEGSLIATSPSFGRQLKLVHKEMANPCLEWKTKPLFCHLPAMAWLVPRRKEADEEGGE
jgi:hypothetical protein